MLNIFKKETFYKWIAYILPILAILFIFRSEIFGLTDNGDVIFNFYNYFSYYLNNGPVISQNILGGFPIFSSVAGVWFYFFNDLFALIFGVFHSYGMLIVSDIILSYVFAYAFLKKIGLSHGISIFGSCVYVFSGQNMLWADTLANANYYFILPLAVYLINLVVFAPKNSHRISLTILLGITLGLSWLSSHVQYVVYIHIFSILYLLFLLFKKTQIIKKTISVLLPSFLISFIFGYPQIQAILDMKLVSARDSGVLLSNLWQGAYWPQDILHYIFPFFQIEKIPFSNPNLYIGLSSFLLLIVGIFVFKKIKDRYFIFFSLTYLFCLVYSLKFSPISFIFHYLPLFDNFREAPRIMFIGNFALSVCIAFIINHAENNKEEFAFIVNKIWSIFKKIFIYIVLPLTIISTLVYIFSSQIGPYIYDIVKSIRPNSLNILSETQYISLFQKFIRETSYQFVFWNRNIIFTIPFSFIIFFVLRRISSLKKEIFIGILTALLLLDIVVVYFNRFGYIDYKDYVSIPRSVEIIRKDSKPDDIYRVYSLFPGMTIFNINTFECPNRSEKFSNVLSKELLIPNRNMDFDIDTLSGYDNFMPKRISHVLNYLGSEQFITEDLGYFKAKTMDQKIELTEKRLNLFRIFNTKYVISHYPINNTDFHLLNNYFISECNIAMYIYKVDGVFPRYFLFENSGPESISTTTKFENLLADLNQDPNKVYIDKGNSKFEIVRFDREKSVEVIPVYGYNTMSFDINAKNDSWLYVGNAMYPSWSATIDGIPIEIKNMNYAFMGIEVPKGKHKVEFRFRIPSRVPFIYHE